MELPARSDVSMAVVRNAAVSNTITYMTLSPRLRKFVLAAALLVMPFQGVAATLTSLLCHSEPQLHALHSAGAPDGAQYQAGAPDEGGAGGNPANHMCCHGNASAPPEVTQQAAPPEFPVRPLAPALVHGFFVPEQPQRPPLA